ncbi:MAG: transglycosylase SLT domain-containing protein [Bacteroidales bacterium]
MQRLLFGLLTFVFFISCKPKSPKDTDIPSYEFDLPQIVAKDTLTVLTLYGSTSYFNYKGDDMGYDYELAKDFAESLGLHLKVVVGQNIHKLQEMLLKGEGDLIAYEIPEVSSYKDSLIFCGRKTENYQVLVQKVKKDKPLIKDVTELIGDSVYIMKDTRFDSRLQNLNEELGGGINIVYIDQDSIVTEDLIEMVSKNEIPFTVADNELAKLNKTYYNDIDISVKISFPQRLAWAVRWDSPILADTLNKWFDENQKKQSYRSIAKRYFEQSKRPIGLPILSISKNKISIHDPLFKTLTKGTTWDWRLLASIAYQETRFDSSQVSWAGALGLMQIMPRTAKAMKANMGKIKENHENIRTSIKVLEVLNESFKNIPDPNQRLKFVLGAYNAGAGHVKDAQALAKKYGKNPLIWDDNVEKFILLKRLPEYYSDPVVKAGYLRGSETYNYVREVSKRFDYYKDKIRV